MNHKEFILEWMITHCAGYLKAKKRHEILPRLKAHTEISDREFRRIVSELKHSGDLCSHSSLGYWFAPLVSIGYNDADEVEWAKKSWRELQVKAFSMLEDSSRHIKRLEEMKLTATGEQREFTI